VWLFVGIVVCLLGLVVFSVNLLSSGRALVSAESAWSKSQKDAIFYLKRYALDRTDQDYRAFERALQVPLALRRARQEIAKAEPDFEAAKAELVRAGSHADDVDGMISLAWRLRNVGHMREANALWASSDVVIDELQQLGWRLHAQNPDAGEAATRQALYEVDRLNQRILPYQNYFAQSLGDALRTGKDVLLFGVLAFSGAMLLLVAGISRRFVDQSERLQRTMQENELQLRELIDSAPLPLVVARRQDDQIVYANERALQQFGLTPAQARGRSMREFYANAEDRDAVMETLDRSGTMRDREVEMQDRNGRRFWLLFSAQRMRYGSEDCLLKAFHNIDDRKRMQEDMRHRATHDPLTNLPNRAMFMDALDRTLRKSRRRRTRISVLFIDLDRFKVINDTLGHHAGDQLLLGVAERLHAAIRDSDLVARLAGDEFVVLVEDHAGPEEVMIVAQKVLESLDRPLLVDWREVTISCSMGIASYPEDGEDVDTLVKNADVAMYQAKERGRNNFQFYSAELNKMTLQRVDLETRLKGALDRGEFFLQYQPEIDLATGRVANVEALLRWHEPGTGLVTPVEFIPLAEETGTIVAIGRWAMEQALNDLKGWRDQGLDLQLSVNVSLRQFKHHELVNDIFQSLQAKGLAPRSLRLEVAETILNSETAGAERALRALKGLGVEIAVDDFGTGFASLGLVRRTEIHAVKIDRAHVAGCPHDRGSVAVVQAVIAMARTLGLRVIAKGVEASEQREALAAMGCDAAQGYYFSKPVAAGEVAALVRKGVDERGDEPALAEDVRDTQPQLSPRPPSASSRTARR
jgi:diguanylate cyclase (GGDEF)-like protein/PAS domain S-box-containing protein